MKSINKIILGLVFFFAISLIPGLVKAGTVGCYDRQLDVNYLYVGYDDYVSEYGCPAAVSYDSSTHYFTPQTGFKITNPGTDYDGRLYAFNPSGMTIQWTGDEKPYYINYEILPGLHAGTADPFECDGGTYVTTECLPASGYRVKTCPFSKYGYICPGYDPQSIATGGYLVSIGVEFEPYVPQVRVEGVDEYSQVFTGQMTVSQNSPVIIRWYSKDVTSCTCTHNGTKGDCGEGISPFPTYAVLASGQSGLSEGEYRLTSDTTFTVECD